MPREFDIKNIIQTLSSKIRISNLLEALDFMQLPTGSKPNSVIKDFSKKQVLTHELSPEFISLEREFIKPIAQNIAHDSTIQNAFIGWPEMDRGDKREFIEYFFSKLADLTGLPKPDIEFTLDKDGGGWSSLLRKISMQKELQEDPLTLMGNCVHEFLGHGRQYYQLYGGERPEIDIEILHEQTKVLGTYLQGNKPGYRKQPAEVHANDIQQIFTQEFLREAKNVFLGDPKEYVALDTLVICRSSESMNPNTKNKWENHFKKTKNENGRDGFTVSRIG